MNPSVQRATAVVLQAVKQSHSRDVLASSACAALLAWYYAAVSIAGFGLSKAVVPAEPLAVLLTGLPIALFVCVYGLTATTMGLLSGRTNRRLLAVNGFVIAAPLLLLFSVASKS